MDRLSQMALFVRVVDAGGLTAAADRLGIAKSTVSKQLRRLEDRLGVQLLVRTSRQLRLTEAGAGFYARAAEVVADAEAAEQAVTGLQEEARGRLRVSAPVGLGPRYLAPLLPEWRARHPAVEVELSLDDRVVDIVQEGFDVAVRITTLADSSLIARKLAPTRLVVVGAPDYLARRGRPETPEDLAGHDCLVYSYQATGSTWALSDDRGRRAAVRVSGPVESNSGDVLLEAAVGGCGLALLPDFIAGDALRAGRLEAVLPGWHGRVNAVYAVYPPVRHVPAKVRAFVDFLAERFGEGGPWSPAAAPAAPSDARSDA